MLGSSHLVSPHRGVARDVEMNLLAALRLPATTGQRLVLTALLKRQMRSALLAGIGRSACRCKPACSARASTASASRRPMAGSCRSEEHTSELQSLMRISYAVFCLKKKKKYRIQDNT